MGYLCPSIGVAIATYKRPNSLLKTLDCIAKQKRVSFHRIQVCVVDDGSPERIESFPDYPFPFEYVYRPRDSDDRPRVYSCRNIAMSHVSGELAMTLDDDLTFDDHHFVTVQLYHLFRDNLLLIPHLSNAVEPFWFTEAFDNNNSSQESNGWVTTQGLTVRREHWNAVGGQDERFDGYMGFADTYLSYRLVQERNCEIILAAGLCVHIDDSETGGSLRDIMLNRYGHRNGDLLYQLAPDITL